MREHIDLNIALACLDNSWRQLLTMQQWSFTKSVGLAVTTSAPYTTGAVTLTNGSPFVSGVGTAFDSSHRGWDLIANGEWYRIVQVDVGAQQLTLDGAYAGPSTSAAPVVLRKRLYPLDDDVAYVLSMVGPHWPLEERTQITIDALDRARMSTGQPLYYAYAGMTDQTWSDIKGNLVIELWPTPNAVYHLPYIGLKRSALSSLSQVIQDVLPVLLNHASIEACLIAFAEDGEAKWMRLAKEYESLFQSALVTFIRQDRLRFGQDEQRSHPILRGRTDIDAP